MALAAARRGVVARFCVTLILILIAQPAGALSWEEGRHLLSRTGFGAPLAEIERLLALERSAAVDRLLAESRTRPILPPPAWAEGPRPPYLNQQDWTRERKDAFREDRRGEVHQLKTWWLAEMTVTPSPLSERMVLFWHNHFTSAAEGPFWSHMLYAQNALFRERGMDSFAALLDGIVRDPMMLRYLDNTTNRKGKPNENFARELMELFTLGEGNYSERDIREVARAFTGWTVTRANNHGFVVDAKQHDSGNKTIFGKTGNFDGNDVAKMLLAHPATARFVVAKLWREFISDAPDAAAVERLAKSFRDSGYAIKPLLREMLLSREFWDPANRTALIKSPVELIVGTIRTFELPIADLEALPNFAKRLGQDVFDPPNVKGWPGGKMWINPQSLLVRHQTIERLLAWQSVSMDPMLSPGAGKTGQESRERLRLRVAAEGCRGGPQTIVRVDGQVVADTVLAFAHDGEALERIADFGDLERRTLDIALDKPAAMIRAVSVEFVNDYVATVDKVRVCDRNLIVDWLQIGGRLVPAAEAVQATSCPGRPGRMLCAGTLSFDLTRPTGGSVSMDMVPMGEGAMTTNGMGMEAASGLASPALSGRRVLRSLDDWARALPANMAAPDAIWRVLTPVAPVGGETAADAAAAIRSVTTDVTYQLK